MGRVTDDRVDDRLLTERKFGFSRIFRSSISGRILMRASGRTHGHSMALFKDYTPRRLALRVRADSGEVVVEARLRFPVGCRSRERMICIERFRRSPVRGADWNRRVTGPHASNLGIARSTIARIGCCESPQPTILAKETLAQ